MRLKDLGCALAVVVGALGCEGVPQCKELKTIAAPERSFLLVEYRTGQSTGAMPTPEITKAPAYDRERERVKAVVLRLPDNCFRSGSGTREVQGEKATGTLESNCGVALQLLESALSRAGYRVLSWSTLMTIEREQKIAVHVAAQQLQADAVFIINDMSWSDAQVGTNADATYKYLEATAQGEPTGPKALFERDRAFVKEFIRSRVGKDPQAKAQKATQVNLNLTSVWAKTGEAMWFYNWRVARIHGDRGGRKFLFAGERQADKTYRWWPVKPDIQEVAPAMPDDVATSEERFESKVDVNTSGLAELYREITHDCIRRFVGGT